MSVAAAAAAAAGAATVVSYILPFHSYACLTFGLKSPIPFSFHQLPTTKRVFLLSTRPSSGDFMAFDSKSMTEMKAIDAFRSSDGDEDGDLYMQTQPILGIGSSETRREVELGGWESALNKSSKWLVSVLFGAIIIWKHDAEAMWAVMGAVLNSSLSIILKRMLNQQRPAYALRSGPGMPSSHAQSISYAVVLAVLSLVEWLGINAFTLTAGALILMCGSYFSWLRVSQRLHTISQVVVGAVIGFIFSILWFWSWDAFMLKAVKSFLWVRIVVILCSAGSCLAFLLHVIRNWLSEDN